MFKCDHAPVVEDSAGSVGVIGLGLMGGSLLRSLVAAGIPSAGWDADPPTVGAAAAADLPVAASLEALVGTSVIAFLAVPLAAVERLLAAVSAVAPPTLVVSDLTSVKQPVRALAARHRFAFVGGHPMAGTAESGFAAGDAGLLDGCPWVLTLDEETDLTAWLGVAATVTALGCRVVPSTSATHDAIVARISHLPHLIAAALTIAAGKDPMALSLAAGSFRDATRVAATRPELSAAMCGGNADAVEAELIAVTARLAATRPLLRDSAGLTALFEAAQAVRAGWPPSAPDELHLPHDADLRRTLLAVGSAGGHVTGIRPEAVLAHTPRAGWLPGPAGAAG